MYLCKAVVMWNDEACCVNINIHKYIIILPFISAAAVHGGVLCAGVLCACALVPYSRCVTAQSLHFTQAVYLKSLCLFPPLPLSLRPAVLCRCGYTNRSPLCVFFYLCVQIASHSCFSPSPVSPISPLTLLPQPQHLKRLLSENRWRRGPPDRTIKTHKEAVSFFFLLRLSSYITK